MPSHDPFEQCFHEHYEGLHRYAYTLLRDHDEAKDAVQAVFINWWEKKDRITIRQSAKAFLYTAVYNYCSNRFRHDKVKKTYADHYTRSATLGVMTDPYAESPREILFEKVAAAIEDLPPQCKLIFRKSRFEEKKYAEIAEELGLSVKTVEVQVGKALKRLRESLTTAGCLLLVLIILLF